MNGWIKIHRKLLDNPISKKPSWAWLWVTLLLLANHDEEHKFIWNKKEVKLEKGQFVTGRKALSDQTGIPPSTVEDILTYLENSSQIRQQKTTKYRLITIVKWDSYQNSDITPTTNRQQTDTFKKLRSKEDKNNTIPSAEAQVVSQVIRAFEAVDSKNKTYYGNKTQRASAQFLVREYGLENVLSVIGILKKTNGLEYVPSVTSPYELKEKWGKLASALQKIKNNQPVII